MLIGKITQSPPKSNDTTTDNRDISQEKLLVDLLFRYQNIQYVINYSTIVKG